MAASLSSGDGYRSYYPSLLQPRRRAEQALRAVGGGWRDRRRGAASAGAPEQGDHAPSNVVGIFPNPSAPLRLVRALLMEQDDERAPADRR